MASRTLPGLALTGFWDLGSAGWKTGMDANLLAVSVLLKAVALSRVTTLPGSPTNGQIFIVPDGETNEKKIAFRDNGAWGYITAWEGLQFWLDDENAFVTFNGTDWAAGTAGSVPEAPIDGTEYVRKNGLWVASAGGGGSNRTISAKTANYTLVEGDSGVKINAGHAATPIAITLPQNSTAAFPIGGWVPIENTDAADVTIAAGSGATAENGPVVLAQGEMAIAWKNTSNGWTITKFGGGGGSAGLPALAGNSKKYLRVKEDESDAEWALTPAPYPSIAGNAGKSLVVNGTEDAVEWASPGGLSAYLNIAFFAGGTPTASTIVARYIAIGDFSVPSGASGSYGKLAVGPSGGSIVFDIRKNGSSIGSLSFSSGATTGSFSISSTTGFAAGDYLDFVAPSNLRSCEDLSVSCLGSL